MIAFNYDNQFAEIEEFFDKEPEAAASLVAEAYRRRAEFLDDCYRAYVILMRRWKLKSQR